MAMAKAATRRMAETQTPARAAAKAVSEGALIATGALRTIRTMRAMSTRNADAFAHGENARCWRRRHLLSFVGK